jgi:hypothetical protein
MNLGLEIQKRLDRLETQKYIGSIEQTRFVRNNTTEMIYENDYNLCNNRIFIGR